MRVAQVLLACCLAAATAHSGDPARIVGGTATTIGVYPFTAAVLQSPLLTVFTKACGSTIIGQRTALTVADCFIRVPGANRQRLRVGSTFANSGGVVHNTAQIIMHPNFDWRTLSNDIAILRTASDIVYNNNVQPARISFAYVHGYEDVWAIGWGRTTWNGQPSEQLRHVQVMTLTESDCRRRMPNTALANRVNDNTLCSGTPPWPHPGGRGQCNGDAGSPLVLHGNMVVGVASWFEGCGREHIPDLNTRVSSFATWIVNNLL